MNFYRVITAAAAALLLDAAVSAQAPQSTPVPMSQQQVNEEMLKELRQIRQLLERLTQPNAPAPTTARVANLKGYALGRADAPLTLVEFTDLQCPYCRQYAIVTFAEIKKNWIDTGKLRYIHHDFPLDIHPQAMAAARAARCAGEQGKFWDMRFTLVANATKLSPEFVAATAAELKLDAPAFAACAGSTRFDAEILADLQEGAAIGVSGTPTFVIGRSAPSSLEGPLIVGAVPYAQFDAKLKALLESAR